MTSPWDRVHWKCQHTTLHYQPSSSCSMDRKNIQDYNSGPWFLLSMPYFHAWHTAGCAAIAHPALMSSWWKICLQNSPAMLKHTPKLRTGTRRKYLQMAQLQPAECACFFLPVLEYPTYILSLLLSFILQFLSLPLWKTNQAFIVKRGWQHRLTVQANHLWPGKIRHGFEPWTQTQLFDTCSSTQSPCPRYIHAHTASTSQSPSLSLVFTDVNRMGKVTPSLNIWSVTMRGAVETASNEHDGVGPPAPMAPMTHAGKGQATPVQQLLGTEAGRLTPGFPIGTAPRSCWHWVCGPMWGRGTWCQIYYYREVSACCCCNIPLCVQRLGLDLSRLSVRGSSPHNAYWRKRGNYF